MFVLTNRAVNEGLAGLEKLGSQPNPRGPNELRAVRAERSGKSWRLEVLPDLIPDRMKAEVNIPKAATAYASHYVAKKLLAEMLKSKRNLLIFVHGYNNDIRAVLDRAELLENRYGVEVLIFFWPADGGGVYGTLSYKNDKRDAKASVGALDRVLLRAHEVLATFAADLVEKSRAIAESRYRHDHEKAEQYFATLVAKGCPFSVNLMLHSMGNYLFKHVILSTASEGAKLTFDNIVLVAADTNNLNHALWVDRIPFRRRLFVTINENDFALRASQMKPGDEQLPRLGCHRHNLDAERATYVDFTGAPKVGNSHAYFEGDPVSSVTSPVGLFFQRALNGEPAEEGLSFSVPNRMFSFR